MAKKILVVDDEHYMRRLMQHHLLRAGYEMVTANNGREAVETATREKPDLVIMDVMMAEMDGLSALKEMKQAEATRHIPVIMLTASANAVTREQSEASGAAAFFTKPFSPTQLLVEIRRLILDSAGT
jgi:two-component system, chemotaxis family, chemotaxis protein CheY